MTVSKETFEVRAFTFRLAVTLALAATAIALGACAGGSGGNDNAKLGDAKAPGGGTTSRPAGAPTGRVGGQIGDTAYDFELVDADGRQVRLSDFKGKVVVLDFWATWCPPCRKEIPGFVALHNELQSKGVEVVGVSLDDDWEPVRPFMSSFDITYTIVLGDQDVADRYGNVRSIPTTFVIDRDGIIRSKHVGYSEPAVFKGAVEKLL
jgi:peroxiredoxin